MSGSSAGEPSPSAGPESVSAAGDLATVEIQDHDGVPVAAISGEVDISNVDDIARRLMTLPNLAPGLVVDLRMVVYMDSTGAKSSVRILPVGRASTRRSATIWRKS